MTVSNKHVDEIETVEELISLKKMIKERLNEIRQHEEAKTTKGIMNWFLRFVKI